MNSLLELLFYAREPWQHATTAAIWAGIAAFGIKRAPGRLWMIAWACFACGYQFALVNHR